MSFDTPNGTRGSRLPSGRLFRWLNNWASRRLRRKGRDTDDGRHRTI